MTLHAAKTYLPVGSGPLATGLGAFAGSYRLAASYLSSRSFGQLALVLYPLGPSKPGLDESPAQSRRFRCTGPLTPNSKARTASSLSLANPEKRAKPSRPTPCRPNRNTEENRAAQRWDRHRRPRAGKSRGIEHLELYIHGSRPPPDILGANAPETKCLSGGGQGLCQKKILMADRCDKPAWERARSYEDNSQATLYPSCQKTK